MYLSGKVGSRPRISAPSAPPSPARPDPTANAKLKTALTLMPSPRATGAVDQDQRDVAARHGERAVGEIDEIHQPERDRKPACQHEQQHAVGDSVEQNGQHGGSSPRRRSYTDGGAASDARPLAAAVKPREPQNARPARGA